MAFQEKQLGQSAPTNTTAVSVYSPAEAGIVAIIKTITVCNTTTSSTTFSIYFDNDGTGVLAANALFKDSPIKANQTIEIDTFIGMNDNTGNLSVETGTANALTFTVWGAEV